ncbi:hypothetical protein JDV02_010572 [Purpureocillium takamizusanense]|uniref:Uncharacterized protein n=1 Tax=Purpureocillium takamizusanense TaxID=2060973 RepID=A0A9Q8QU96_9HYPO|nr:uncharacterized protein JDV02_010572 [Purpureocillium takamizusanense]UNI24854.1 hypothetical protein JDV02_010572 [Purpureocillium takamizusanense]
MTKLHQLFAANVDMHRAESYPSDSTYLAADAELMRRFHNVLIDDSELRDAGLGEVRRYVSNWIESIPEPRGGPRYNTFVLLDSQVVDNLNRLPDKLTTEEWDKMYQSRSHEWIKFVDVDEHSGENIRVWVWDLLGLYSIIIYKDYGVAEVVGERGFRWRLGLFWRNLGQFCELHYR